MTNKNPDEDKWYAIWYITDKFQKEPIEKSIKDAIEYFSKKLGTAIKSVEVSKQNNEKKFEVDGITVTPKKEVLLNHVLLEFEPQKI